MSNALVRLAATVVASLVLPGASLAQPVASSAGPLTIETVASGLEHPWGLAFLPDGRMLVTERPGRMRIVDRSGTLSAPLAGLPPVAASGQGGLLDVALDPSFATNRLVYWTYAEPRSDGSGTSVARARLSPDNRRLEDATIIFRQMPTVRSSLHFGSRLVFSRDGHLFVTLGERFFHRDKAQDLGTHFGKVVRIKPDGGVPADNPFVGKEGALPEIWSYGHRNPQGAALHPETGQLWEIEHGAKGGDEVNLPQPGLNYGWPVITYGVDYSGAKIGIGTHKEGMEQPLFYWDPSIAPSGAAFVTSDRYPSWKGSLLIGALAGQMLVRLQLGAKGVQREERLLTELGERIRDVRQGPDGLVYLLTDNPKGRILRLMPGR